MPESSVQVRKWTFKDLSRAAAEGRLWAILDACDEPLIPPKIMELGPEKSASLFRGQAEHQQWAIAPYVARVDVLLLDWIVGNLWEKPWGVFAVAECNLKSLRRHFRQFLIVQTPESETMYFRYYDPRILGVFLLTCTREELKAFFGPIKAFALGSTGVENLEFFFNIHD